MLLHPWDFPGKSAGVGCHFLLQRIFPTHGSNLGLPHYRQTLYRLSRGGSDTPSLNALQFLDTLPPCKGSVSDGDLVGMREPHFLLKKMQRKLNTCISCQNPGSSSVDNLPELSKLLCLPRTRSVQGMAPKSQGNSQHTLVAESRAWQAARKV